MNMNRGRLIIIEGGEGSGKTSLVKVLKSELPSESTIFTREPGGTPLADEIRAMLLGVTGETISPLTHFALFWAARRAHIELTILPALESGKNVICDRFDGSTYAYQIWGQENHNLKLLFQVMRDTYILRDITPYLYVYLDVEPQVGLARSEKRGDQNHFDQKDLEFHQRVRKGYLEFLSGQYHRKVDAGRPQAEVIAEAREIIKSAIA